jgi:hypothetical protein
MRLNPRSMMTWILAWALGVTALPALAGPVAPVPVAPAPAATATTVDVLAQLAPSANPDVLALALAAMNCAKASGIAMAADRIAVIDYSRPSLEPRLWVFDLAGRRLLFEELVAHGQGSGENRPTRFSNAGGSHASSLGLFVTGDTYLGRNGYSMRMDGLEPGVNDRARDRAIVLHGAPYVDAVFGQQQGRIGRSWGCPAVREAVARQMIDVLKGGQFVFAYYPDSGWLTRSALLRCSAA